MRLIGEWTMKVHPCVICLFLTLYASTAGLGQCPGSWTPLAPGPRINHAMVYDSVRGRVVLFGGIARDNTSEYGDTWEWDGFRWERVATNGPAPRSKHAMAYDP